MPRTLYLHANGRKIAQVKDGVRTDYLTDALGSVTATKNQSQQIVNTYRWKPYGGQLAKTGTGEDPKYGWAGDTGSRITKTNWVNQYNVFRHYGSQQAAWTTVDPYWPQEWAYGYVGGSPLLFVDPFGLQKPPPKAEIIGIGTGAFGADLCLPGAAPGKTACNYVTGKPFVKLCTGFCDRDCTLEHELIHVGQMSSCCELAGKCMKLAKTGPERGKCQIAFEEWQKKNEKRFECEGYKVSCSCFINSLPPSPDLTCCFDDYVKAMMFDCDQAAKLCNNIPPYVECPFREDGTIR